ncbi:MAG TPA: tripartite tricarboxylate transporter substrate binding protein [Burkholderiales bacterium]|nr:tripartite tricarboxylate transporter substrate binding protein [Burkholderiales bacterium]
MNTRISLVTATMIAAAGALLAASPSHAQGYPAKTIRMIVPIAPGGGTDTMARLISQRVSEQLGVTIFVDNRAGAGTVIGTELFSKSPPDGYTLMTVAPEFVINPSLRKLPYDPVRDFTCVTQLTSGQYFLSTHPAVPVKTTKQFVALAKSRPGQVSFGSSGNGSANHLAGVLFGHMSRTNLVHVPYKGAGPAGIALLSGEIDFMFSNVASSIPYVRQGKVRAIASTGEKRSSVAPDIPTVSESGVPGFVVIGFFILLAPANTPADIVTRLNTESSKALESAVMKERLAGLGLEPVGKSSAECNTFIKSEIAKWAPIVKAAGAKVD